VNSVLVLNHFNGKYAILESPDKSTLIFNFPGNLLSPEANEEYLHFSINLEQEETEKRKERKLKW
jgi:hypothetical protein